jgi:hypothetical protein
MSEVVNEQNIPELSHGAEKVWKDACELCFHHEIEDRADIHTVLKQLLGVRQRRAYTNLCVCMMAGEKPGQSTPKVTLQDMQATLMEMDVKMDKTRQELRGIKNTTDDTFALPPLSCPLPPIGRPPHMQFRC